MQTHPIELLTFGECATKLPEDPIDFGVICANVRPLRVNDFEFKATLFVLYLIRLWLAILTGLSTI